MLLLALCVTGSTRRWGVGLLAGSFAVLREAGTVLWRTLLYCVSGRLAQAYAEW